MRIAITPLEIPQIHPVTLTLYVWNFLDDVKNHYPNIPDLPPEVLEGVMKAASQLGLIPPVKFEPKQ